MGKGIAGAIMKMMRVEDIPCEVTRTWMHTPTMKAVRVSSREFVRTQRPAEGEYLRCWLAHPDNPGKEAMRGYTMIDIDYDAGDFTLLFLLHQPLGPAAAWAANAKVGDTFDACYYGSAPFDIPEQAPQGFVLVVDAAGIPYVNAMIEQLADEFPVRVWVLDWHETDHEIPITEHPNAVVEWVEPTQEAPLDKARAFNWDGWYPHLICESKILLATRRYLLKEVGMSKDWMHVHAYWKQGKSMGTSRDVKAA